MAKQCPKVCLFQKDHDMIEELVRCSPTEETGGDLFGLWTSDGEPVLHIVTGQGREPQSSQKRTLDNLKTVLKKRFHLSYIGRWQYAPRLQHNGSLAIEAVGQEYLRKRSKAKDMQDFLLIMIDYDNSSRKLQFSPYLLSHVHLPTAREGEREIIELPGESAFTSDDEEVKLLVSELMKKNDRKAETESSPDKDSGSGRDIHESTDGKTEVPPTDALSSDVEMKDLSSSSEDRSGWETFPATQLGMQAEFTCNRRGFKVYLFEEDRKMMEDLVLRYQDLETGGDLFGLWNGEGDAVIHIALGPGKDCKRTDVSFYQDIPYLQRTGELLTHKYMLCHIGEWHSHHRLNLFRPSQGDSSTVIRNYPRGTCGFLLIIANIVSSTRVEFSPYLYTARSDYSYDQKGELVVLSHPNAFKRDPAIQRSMKEGKETEIDRRHTGGSYYQGYPANCSTSTNLKYSYHHTQASASRVARVENKSNNRSNWR